MTEPDWDFQNKVHEDLKQTVRVLRSEKATLQSENNVLTDKLEEALRLMKDYEARWMAVRRDFELLKKSREK